MQHDAIPRSPNPKDEEESLSETEESRTIRLNNNSLAQNIDERKKYAKRAYKITKIWLIGLAFAVLLQMLPKECHFQHLTEKEFITLITTTTASIFGFWYLVMKYLFPKPPSEKK